MCLAVIHFLQFRQHRQQRVILRGLQMKEGSAGERKRITPGLQQRKRSAQPHQIKQHNRRMPRWVGKCFFLPLPRGLSLNTDTQTVPPMPTHQSTRRRRRREEEEEEEEGVTGQRGQAEGAAEVTYLAFRFQQFLFPSECIAPCIALLHARFPLFLVVHVFNGLHSLPPPAVMKCQRRNE